jgi:carotenoid cleavage dioxygenase-like enzyme
MRCCLSLLACVVVVFSASKALSHSEVDGYSGWWESTWRHIPEPTPTRLNGTIPSWLRGRGMLVRNAGGAYESTETESKRNLTYAYDGLPKLFKFDLRADGQVMYQERFLNTSYYQYTQEHGDIPRFPLMGAPNPAFPRWEIPRPQYGDNTNTQVWRIKGDPVALATTDSAVVQSFDPETLATVGPLKWNDTVKHPRQIQLSCAHPQQATGALANWPPTCGSLWLTAPPVAHCG